MKKTVLFTIAAALAASIMLDSCQSAKQVSLPGTEITDWQARHEKIMETTFATREQVAAFPSQKSPLP